MRELGANKLCGVADAAVCKVKKILNARFAYLTYSTNVEYVAIGRQAPPKISLKKTPLERLCPSREPPRCVPASLRYRTHDGTCNNARRPRWGSAQMPFHRFLAPEYSDGVEGIRRSVTGASLPSARFVSLVVHGSRNEEAPVTMMLALWGQLIDHDLTATAQPRPINGSTPRCCGGGEDSTHPSCLPIKVPQDDPWLSQLGVRCLEFLRSAPAQRRDCLLHEDTAEGDFGGPGSLHRLLRGMVNQRALKRDEFITAELTNHLFQTKTLGGGGTLQPFAFLPPDFGQNERLPCETRLMAPIDLDPWAERDPFTNDATNSNGTNEEDDDDWDDSEEEEQGEEQEDNTNKNATDQAMDTTAPTVQLTTFSSTSTITRGPPTILLNPLTGNVLNKVDLITNGNTGLQQRPTVIKGQKATATTLTAPTPTILVSNKLDLNSPTPTNRPAQPLILVAGATVVDHKLDLQTTTTKRPSTTKRKQTRKPTTKKRPQTPASVSNLPFGGISNNLDFSASRRTVNGSTTTTRRRRTRRTVTKRDARHGTAYYYQTPAPTDYTDDYDDQYNSDYDPPPYLAYGYHRPPTTTTTTTPEPTYSYYHHPFGGYYTVPSTVPPQPPYPYFDTRRPTLHTRTTTVRRKLSDKLTLSDATSRPRPLDNSDLTRPNKPFLKPASGSSSHSSVFSVDFRRSLAVHDSGISAATASTSTTVSKSVASSASTTNDRNKLSAANQLLPKQLQRRTFFASNGTRHTSLSSTFPLPSDLPMKLSESFPTNDYDDYQDDQTNLQTKRDDPLDRPTAERLQEEHDGYLRPEQTHFEPLVRPDRPLAYRDYYRDGSTKTLPYRRDYTATADRTRSDVDSPLLYRPDATQTVRYASTYNDPLLLDDYSDKFVGLLILDDSDHDHHQDHGALRPKERSIRDDVTTQMDGKQITRLKHDKRPNGNKHKGVPLASSTISMVPFVLLTNIDRPDNWVMYHSKPSKRRKPPPPVPLLKSDTFSLSELPQPIIGPD
uniref:Uncharacterized protein n=1 Tax=Anopheles albimanus TaxID=7167 RepID=A0A182F8F5_ANOAL